MSGPIWFVGFTKYIVNLLNGLFTDAVDLQKILFGCIDDVGYGAEFIKQGLADFGPIPGNALRT